MTTFTMFIARLWRTSAPLTASGLLMLPVLAGAAAGLWLDDRLVTGAPVWLKPAKFAISVGIYTLSLAWVLTHLPAWRRTRTLAGWVTAVTLLLEIAIIYGQAWRGTASHFNVGAPLDAALFSLMGAAILVQTLASVAVAVALWRERFTERALAWALRLGLTFTIAGAATGGLMTRPTETQRAAPRIVTAGAHTVGAPDGGPGLPGTGWSVEHGDLRVPHFIGLHALQAFALLLAALPARWSAIRRARIMVAAAASYFALFTILLWQALSGESIAAPGVTMLGLLGVWVVASGVGLTVAAGRNDPVYADSVVC